MLANSLYLFTQGVLLGWGPCLLFCGVYILPAATFSVAEKKNMLGNLIAFMTGRFLMYIFLGVSTGFVGFWILKNQFTEFFRGSFLVVLLGMGIYILLRKNASSCYASKTVQRNFFLLGIFVGLAPCIPLLGILMQILLITERFYEPFIYSIAFGLGTLLNPLWLILWGVAEVKDKLLNKTLITALQRLIGAFLIIFAALNIYKLF